MEMVVGWLFEFEILGKELLRLDTKTAKLQMRCLSQGHLPALMSDLSELLAEYRFLFVLF